MCNFFKRLSFITLLGILIATNNAYAGDPDINDDGIVDQGDISTVGKCMRKDLETNQQCEIADTNEDGIVDDEDMRYIISHRGETGFAFFAERDESKVIADSTGGVYQVNHLIVSLNSGYDMADAKDLAASIGGKVVGSLGVEDGGLYQFEVPSNSAEELEALEQQLENDNRVDHASPNYIGEPYSTDMEMRTMEEKAAYSLINTEEAWKLMSGIPELEVTGQSIVVSDTGIDLTHMEFDNTTVTGKKTDTIPPAIRCLGILEIQQWPDHGTSVSGVIAAENDGFGMNGIMTGVGGSFGQLQVINNDKAALWNLINAENIDVVNMSWGYERCSVVNSLQRYCEWVNGDEQFCLKDEAFSDTEKDLIKIFNALEAKNPNVILVAAAGNQGQDANTALPAGIDHNNLITVGATDTNNFPAAWSGSNTGTVIDIAAPGTNVLVPIATDPNELGSFHKLDGTGTSFSAPMVTGVVGLMKSIDPDLSPSDIKDIIHDTGDDTNPNISGKQVNAARAVACVMQLKGHDVQLNISPPLDANLKKDIEGDLAKTICGASDPVGNIVTFSNPVIEVEGLANRWSEQLLSKGFRLFNLESKEFPHIPFYDAFGHIGWQWRAPLLGRFSPVFISAIAGKKIKSITFDIFTPFLTGIVVVDGFREGRFDDPPTAPNLLKVSDAVRKFTSTLIKENPEKFVLADSRGFTNIIIGNGIGLSDFYIDNIEIEIIDAP